MSLQASPENEGLIVNRVYELEKRCDAYATTISILESRMAELLTGLNQSRKHLGIAACEWSAPEAESPMTSEM